MMPLVERPLGVDCIARAPAAGRARVDRISLVFFTNPNPDAVIRCIESCVKAGETAKNITP